MSYLNLPCFGHQVLTAGFSHLVMPLQPECKDKCVMEQHSPLGPCACRACLYDGIPIAKIILKNSYCEVGKLLNGANNHLLLLGNLREWK